LDLDGCLSRWKREAPCIEISGGSCSKAVHPALQQQANRGPVTACMSLHRCCTDAVRQSCCHTGGAAPAIGAPNTGTTRGRARVVRRGAERQAAG